MRDLAIVPQRLLLTLYNFRRTANKPIIQAWMVPQVLKDPNFTPHWAPLFGRAQRPLDGIGSQTEKKVKALYLLPDLATRMDLLMTSIPQMTALKS